MSEARSQPKRIEIEDVVREERKTLRLPLTENPDVYSEPAKTEEPRATNDASPSDSSGGEPNSDEPWALCLSGGGIRSATFGLGVLQGLARLRELRRFHYLSTVSGGGYLGSWLSRWIHEEDGNLEGVEQALRGERAGKYPSGEPRQLRSLRAYSNYLSPVWGLSTDFFTLVAIFLRNLLLTWLVLLPLLFALVLLPRLYVGASVDPPPSEIWVWILILISGGLIVLGLAYVVADLPSAQCPAHPPRDRFPLLCFLPIAGAAALLGIIMGWRESVLSRGEFFHYAIAGAALHVLGCIAGVLWRKKRQIGERTETQRGAVKALVIDALVIAVSGGAGGALVYALAIWLPLTVPAFRQPALHATVAAPVLLVAFWLATTLYVALVKYWSSEGDREWWARSGAWWLRFALFWLLGFGLVIYVPQWIANVLDGNAEYAAAGGGLWGILVALIGYWTKNGAKIRDRAQTVVGTIGMRALDLAAVVFIVGLLIAFCFAIDAVIGNAPEVFNGTRAEAAALKPDDTAVSPLRTVEGVEKKSSERAWGAAYSDRMEDGGLAWPLTLFGTLLALSAFSACFVGVNTFSLHSMYGNRLVRAYFGAARDPEKRKPHWFTGFDFGDNVGMGKLKTGWVSGPPDVSAFGDGQPTRVPRLLHIVNIALNLVSPTGGRLEWQQRKAASFTVSQLHSGSDVVGFLESSQYSGISLGRAMTISGAAASSNMGYHSSTPVALVMTIFNVRLGWWLPNPGYKGRLAAFANAASEPRWALRPLLWEALSATNEQKPYLYLSDGGHFDNLGVYEMVRRGCRRIVVVDASADPTCAYDDLQDVVRKIRVDFGVSIEFRPLALGAPQRCVMGTIGYRNGRKGDLYYIKPTLCGDEPLDLLHYARESRARSPKNAFPHQSTGDQFFNEAQFESYRLLGMHTIMQLWTDEHGSLRWPDEESLRQYQQKVASYVTAGMGGKDAAKADSAIPDAEKVGGSGSFFFGFARQRGR